MSIRSDDSHKEGGGRFPILPPNAPGMRIGLFGGTFDPPHAGHVLASLIALRRLGLDRVWWLVTPGNPLKTTLGPPSLSSRVRLAREAATDPRIVVTDFEAALGARYTHQTVSYLLRRCPGVNFIWIMGADNLANFHRWRRWREIAENLAIAVVDRPDSTLRAAHSPAGEWLERFRVPERRAGAMPRISAPAYIFLHGPRSALSSTAIRNNQSHTV